MRFEFIIVLVVVGIAALIGAAFFLRRHPRRLKVTKFNQQWQELQGLCRDKATWPAAITAADNLLEKALKRRRFRGKSMGERLVAAQRVITDNDAVWFAHNLKKKLVTNPTHRLRKEDVKDALMGFRQALQDIGALPNGKDKKS